MKRILVQCLRFGTLVGIGIAVAAPALASDSEPIERARVHTMPEIGAHSVWVPDRLSPEQEGIYQQLKGVEDPAPERIADADRGGFWSRVKEAFRAG